MAGVDCDLPRNQLVVITGPSGSGKSSLAFDTIYAEGQRRYVESLSAYARQFLEQLPKPKVESIEGLSPSIAIEQRALGKSPRSTVGTVTEIADYLRLLFARIGVPHCPVSGQVLHAFTVQEMVDAILERGDGARLAILAPIARQTADLESAIEGLRREGFVRARVDGVGVDLGDDIAHDPAQPHDLDVVVDRIVVKHSAKGRITDSVELALDLGDGTLLLDALDDTEPVILSERLVSWEHGITLPPLEPRLFSFNSPHGACPSCDGLGMRSRVDPARIVVDPTRSLREGAITSFGRRGSVAAASEVDRVVKLLAVDPDCPWEDLPEEQRSTILFGGAGRGRRKNQTYPGVVPSLEARLEADESDSESDDELDDGALRDEDVGRYVVTRICDECGGSRLRREALAVKVSERSIAEVGALSLVDLRAFLSPLGADLGQRDATIAQPLLKAVTERLGFLIDVGLGYLSLDRSARTLSGGEGQRIRLATQIGASLIGVLYVLDEPSVGLHARDNARLLTALRKLVDKGNSVLVVEHDREAILAADYVVDMGPGAGSLGGKIVAEGTPQQLMSNPASITGPYLSGVKRLPIPTQRKAPGEQVLRLVGARAHNLRDVSVDIPLGLITAVTGVSGSGKSSLIVDTLLAAARSKLYGARSWVGPCDDIQGLELIDKVISIDQAPIGRTPRSNPATYTGVFTHLRELYATLPDARARGYRAGRFSFNVKGGRCEACQGDGVLRVEMHFLPDVYVTCDTCGGKRYNRETLEIHYRGLSIASALELTVDEAFELFEAIPRIRQRLAALRDVGLGYIRLGQPATTLSGGEAQRVKLATELARTATGSTLYVLDEPTTGLHFQDIELLSHALFGLRDAGNSVLVIEHNLDLVACADWVIDLGPEGGSGGGRIVTVGTPEQVAHCEASYTGRFLSIALNDPHGSKPTSKSKRGSTPANRDAPAPQSKPRSSRASKASPTASAGRESPKRAKPSRAK